MKKCLLLILCLLPMSLFASQSSLPLKGMIETYNLEAQTIVLNGQSYHFAPGAIIKDKQDIHVGFQALNIGQIVRYKTGSPANEELTTESISVIKIISDNRNGEMNH